MLSCQTPSMLPTKHTRIMCAPHAPRLREADYFPHAFPEHVVCSWQVTQHPSTATTLSSGGPLTQAVLRHSLAPPANTPRAAAWTMLVPMHCQLDAYQPVALVGPVTIGAVMDAIYEFYTAPMTLHEVADVAAHLPPDPCGYKDTLIAEDEPCRGQLLGPMVRFVGIAVDDAAHSSTRGCWVLRLAAAC